MAVGQQQLEQAIYDLIKGLTQSPRSMAMADTDTRREQLSTLGQGYITLEVPPRPADELSSPEALARAADEVLYLEPRRRANGRSVAELYGEILGAAIMAPAVKPKDVTDARRLLFTDDGEQVPTSLFAAYLYYKKQYDAARTARQSGKDEWRALQTAQPGRVEAALAVLAQYRQRDLGTAFAAAREAFAAGQREGVLGRYPICNASPASFWALEAPPSDAGNPEDRVPVRVLLERPWLRLTLLRGDGWWVPGRAAGAYSNGRADQSNHGLWAIVPTALFVGWDEDEAPVILGWDNLAVPRCPPRSAPPP